MVHNTERFTHDMRSFSVGDVLSPPYSIPHYTTKILVCQIAFGVFFVQNSFPHLFPHSV